MAELEVLIVGAGVIGLAIARDLARAGLGRQVLVLDRGAAVGSGSTARANGGVRAQFSTAINVQFSSYTIAEFEKLDRDTGGLPRLVQAGYLLMTGSPQGEESLRRGFELQRSLGVGVEWLDPGRILGMAPFVRAAGLRAGSFSPRDGFIDPHGVSQALWQDARQAGAGLR
ncbi:MAG: NAD(P)/FAD-dependent oxidoreductase, partial [Planctomycetota bacterium]